MNYILVSLCCIQQLYHVSLIHWGKGRWREWWGLAREGIIHWCNYYTREENSREFLSFSLNIFYFIFLDFLPFYSFREVGWSWPIDKCGYEICEKINSSSSTSKINHKAKEKGYSIRKKVNQRGGAIIVTNR